MHQQDFTGDLPDIVNNVEGLYEGDLRHYFKIVFEAPNIYHGYHGLRHMLHVTWVCYQACVYYSKLGQLSPRKMRNLLIGALLHDYGHTGKGGNDSINIAIAITGLQKCILDEDKPNISEIERIIASTLYPHADLGDSPMLEQLIIRDADISQVFGTTWIGDIIAGLGGELGKRPVEMLEQQSKFLGAAQFHSDFGKVFFGKAAIIAKQAESSALLKILNS